MLATTDMLTPIDQPLDKLDDLKPDEMYVAFTFLYPLCSTERVLVISENMHGASRHPDLSGHDD